MMINKRLISTCRESKKYIALTVLINWISILCNIAMVFIIGNVINEFSKGRPMEEYSFIILGIILVIRFIANLMSGKFSHKASAKAKVTLRDMIYHKLLTLGLSYNEEVSTSSVVQVAVEGVEQLEVYFGKYLPQFFYALLAPVTLFVVISFISFKTALIFILCVPLIPISIIAIMKVAKRILKNYWSSYSNLGETFLENLQGLTTLKVFHMDGVRHKKMNEEAESFRKVTMKVLSMQLNSITVMDLIAFGGSALGSIVALYEFINGRINTGQVVTIILLSSEFFIPLRLLGSFFHVAMNGIAASERIFAILDMKETMEPKAHTINKLDNISIELKNVTFSYDKERDVLKNISMAFHNRTFNAIVGQSGSGKSTIASLILNTYKIDTGKICFNSMDIHDIPLDHIYERVALISTNSYIFNGTIGENLLIGKKEPSIEEINRALDLANLKEFVDSLEYGLDTKTGEGGSLLSGGQKQRLALARAILSDREIMIFDEATSNIDVESEEMIWKSINHLAKEKTVIVISHRLANVKNAHKIYVMNEGNLVEEGTHKELMDNKGKYYDMIKNQELLERKVAI